MRLKHSHPTPIFLILLCLSIEEGYLCRISVFLRIYMLIWKFVYIFFLIMSCGCQSIYYRYFIRVNLILNKNLIACTELFLSTLDFLTFLYVYIYINQWKPSLTSEWEKFHSQQWHVHQPAFIVNNYLYYYNYLCWKILFILFKIMLFPY